ncbi:hypothetical protein ACJMK2_021625 [Sinanodonta woodiana]|uniref:Uncharacterized protein n=1 Tax=Sinanodonta woodiana TaxID=1069815 RepID=A0ABD3TI79_SINWO
MAFARAFFTFASSSHSSYSWTVFILIPVISFSTLPAVLGSCFCSPCNYLLNGDERCKCCVYHLMGKKSGDPRTLNFRVNEEPESVRDDNFVEFDTILPRLDTLYPGSAVTETLPSLWSRNSELGFDRKVSYDQAQIQSNLPPNEVTNAKEDMKSVTSELSDPAFARDYTAVKNKSGRNVKQFLQGIRYKFDSPVLGLDLNRRWRTQYPLNQVSLW